MDLFDSPVICEYLDSLHKGRKLLPRKGRERWVALRLQAMADGLLDAAILTRYEGALRPKDKRWPDWIKGQDQEDRGRARPTRGRGQIAEGQAHNRHHIGHLRAGLCRLTRSRRFPAALVRRGGRRLIHRPRSQTPSPGELGGKVGGKFDCQQSFTRLGATKMGCLEVKKALFAILLSISVASCAAPPHSDANIYTVL